VSDTPEERFDFEQALAELEAIVQRMERGELPLEESLAQFERGVRLARQCQQALDAAEQKVDALMAQGDGADVQPLDIEHE